MIEDDLHSLMLITHIFPLQNTVLFSMTYISHIELVFTSLTNVMLKSFTKLLIKSTLKRVIYIYIHSITTYRAYLRCLLHLVCHIKYFQVQFQMKLFQSKINVASFSVLQPVCWIYYCISFGSLTSMNFSCIF